MPGQAQTPLRIDLSAIQEGIRTMQTTASPLTVRAAHNMARIRQDEARRANLRKNGVKTALTRAELAALPVLRDVAPHARRVR